VKPELVLLETITRRRNLKDIEAPDDDVVFASLETSAGGWVFALGYILLRTLSPSSHSLGMLTSTSSIVATLVNLTKFVVHMLWNLLGLATGNAFANIARARSIPRVVKNRCILEIWKFPQQRE
jgi:hypothetical protein